MLVSALVNRWPADRSAYWAKLRMAVIAAPSSSRRTAGRDAARLTSHTASTCGCTLARYMFGNSRSGKALNVLDGQLTLTARR